MKGFFLHIMPIVMLLIVIVVACKKEHVTNVTLNKTDITLYVGQTETLIATVHPENATNKTLRWTSNNSDVVILDNNGKVSAIKVTGKEIGTATIIVTTKDGGYVAECNVRVIFFEPEMVFVEGGTFMMGSNFYNFEQPIHQVTVSSFNIAKYQVTQREWKVIMGNNNPSSYKGDDLPVHKVSWNDIQEFITQLNNATGKSYRFPTEAEWEYAARGGKKNVRREYSGSNDINVVAWYRGNCSDPQPVGVKAANELGIYDMSGNVWEWCNDWYGYYSHTPQTDPQGSISGTYRIIRGGDFNSISSNCRVAMRMRAEPDKSPFYCGFRLVHP